MANETWKFVQAKSKQAMKQVLGCTVVCTYPPTLPKVMNEVKTAAVLQWNMEHRP